MIVIGLDVGFVCGLCALRQLVTTLERGGELPPEPPQFSGSFEDHVEKEHPNEAAAKAEREDLMRRYKAQQDRRAVLAKNARNN